MAEQGGFEREFARVEALMRDWSLEEATGLLEAIKGAGTYPNRLRHDLSVLYAQQGFFAEALREIEEALELEPGNRALWHHFLAIQKNNPRQPTAHEWRAMHLGYGETVRDLVDARHIEVARSLDPERRLRVGYLCLDTHLATERFVWPVLTHFDAARFEVFAYWCHSEVTPQLRESYPGVMHRSILGATDEAVTATIVADAVDIVVDVAGHGAGNRLPVLCKRPAPVAMTWLDYLATTGLDTVDYRITDSEADPEGAEAAHVERLLRLPVPQWCYRSPAVVDEPRAPPERDHVVFGSVSVPLKLSEAILDLWARVLARVPGSRLRLLGMPAGRAIERVRARLAAQGIDASRVETRPRLDTASFFRELAELDVVLDTHPFSGATSTCDALWQGVPVVTLTGPLSHSRSTSSILAAIGAREWVADSPESYVDICASLAEVRRSADDRDRLSARLRDSPVCDGAGFARAFEGAMRQAWMERTQHVEHRPRDITTAFWRGVRTKAPNPSVARIALASIACVVDVSDPRAAEILAGCERDWVLLTHSGHFLAPAAGAMIPSMLLERFDVLAPLGAQALTTGDITAAGQGFVRGVSMVTDAESGKLFASAWVPDGTWPCAALAGGAMLVRRSLLADVALSSRSPDALGFECDVIRASHRMRLDGARLGVSVALARAQRSWTNDPARRHAAMRAVEEDLGLPHWGQLRPSARPMKAATTEAVWSALLPGLEEVCDG